MKTAVIAGCDGQDGRLLYDFLCERGYAIAGIARDRLRVHTLAPMPTVDILQPEDVALLFDRVRPDEVYYLAAYHHSSENLPEDPKGIKEQSRAIHVDGLRNFLEAILKQRPECRIFYAASALVFGRPETSPQVERTPLRPIGAYETTKAEGIRLCRKYRVRHSLFASAGILYNHESPYRPLPFLSRKIIAGALAIKDGKAEKLILGDLSARRDWGWAPDTVAAMHAILRHEEPGDFVVATGKTHSVRDFAAAVFSELGMDWKDHVEEDSSLLSRDRTTLVGDSSKLRKATGWQPSVDFKGMIRALLEAERRKV